MRYLLGKGEIGSYRSWLVMGSGQCIHSEKETFSLGGQLETGVKGQTKQLSNYLGPVASLQVNSVTRIPIID